VGAPVERLVFLLPIAVVFAELGCHRTTEPAEGDDSAADASSKARATSSTAEVDAGPKHREPDWVLDPADPARDYVGRYLRSTLRYGADTSCVILGSSFRNGESVVEVRNPADATCGAPGALRDTFLVNVAEDRMSLDDPGHHPALRPWPDGSSPDGPPGPVTDNQNLTRWKAPLHDVIEKLKLFPLRIQLYGRGTYPVISLAGWHDVFDPKGDISLLREPAKQLCEVNSGAPMAFIGGMDRTLVLRIDCPANPRWESL